MAYTQVMCNSCGKTMSPQPMTCRGCQTRGEKNHSAKLTQKDVIRIRTIAKKGVKGSQVRLARQYGVSEATISNIVHGKKWRHL